jgi:hypothetical protein
MYDINKSNICFVLTLQTALHFFRKSRKMIRDCGNKMLGRVSGRNKHEAVEHFELCPQRARSVELNAGPVVTIREDSSLRIVLRHDFA